MIEKFKVTGLGCDATYYPNTGVAQEEMLLEVQG